MNNRLLAVLIIFPIWLTLVLVFRRQRQWLLYYIIAAFGLVLQVVFLAEYFGLDQMLVNVASFQVSLIGKGLFHFNLELLSNGRFQLIYPDGSSSILKLGIECSAILESSILFGLIAFYPLFNLRQKILRITFGLIVTYAINLIRLLIIILMTYKLGPDYIFVAHAFVARAFFFLAELVLYWYLITKPTVKIVGDAIQDGTKIEKTAQIGKSLRLRHALGQLTIIFLVLLVSILSFSFSDEWKKSFAGGTFKRNNRPIIYQEETKIESTNQSETITSLLKQMPLPTSAPTPTPMANAAPKARIAGESTKSLNQQLKLSLKPGQKQVLGFEIEKREQLNIQIIQGKEELAARIFRNGQEVDFTSLVSWRYLKEKSIFEPVAVQPGDYLEIRFQNVTDSSAEYLLAIYPKESNGQ